MPILYRMHQDNRKNSAHKGKWYARAVMNGTVGIDEVAEVMQRNCTLKKSDIRAVIAGLFAKLDAGETRRTGFVQDRIEDQSSRQARKFQCGYQRRRYAGELSARGYHRQKRRASAGVAHRC